MQNSKSENVLIIKGELIDLNTYINAERANRYKGAAIKRLETERVFWECKEQKIKPVGKKSLVIFEWYNKNSRKDFDNIEFAQKFIWDGLVMAKVLPEDNQENTPAMRLHIHEVDPENPRVEIHFPPEPLTAFTP